MSEKANHPAPVLRLLNALARSVGDANGGGKLARAVRVCQVLLWVATGSYAVALCGGLLWLEYAGDSWWLTWPLLYVPSALFLLPLLALSPCALLLDWRQLAVHGLCVLAVFLLYEDVEWHRARSPREGRLAVRILSNNIGQHGKYPLTPFVEQHDPDIILLQEAARRGEGYVKQYGARGLHTAFVGEFVCASRFPVVESALLAETTCDGRPVAARFVLDAPERKLVVYNVHLASPRELLGKLRGRGLVAQLLHEAGVSAGRDYRAPEQVAERLAAARKLADRIAGETGAVLVAGDFNVPARGRAYHLLAGSLADAFEARGRGYGFTFPGRTRNPLTLFGPWLRLDLVFAGKGWRVLDCQVEPRRPSQHRALVATLEWDGP